MSNEYLAHYGTKGQKWGLRRFQNEDGSLTPAGRERYGVGPARADRKVNLAELAVYETGYQAKRLRKAAAGKVASAGKSVGKYVANDVKNVAKSAWDTTKESISPTNRRIRKRNAQLASDREKAQRLEAKKEKLAKKLVDEQNKKTISDLKNAIDDAQLANAKKKVDSLKEHRDRIKEKAMLKEEQRQLKKEIKNAKKDAEKEAKEKFSRKKIKSLSDEELNARITRLKKEIELAGLESSRNVPKAVTDFTSAIISSGTEAVKFIAKDTVTALGKEALNSIGLGDLVYPSNKRSPWSSEAVNERREQERRVRAYKKSDLTIEEIAQRMNISESKVKDLLYTING